MTDTKCANPEYQLDVDVMMLEYTAYKAVELQIQNLRYQIDEFSGDGTDGTSFSPAATTVREQAITLQQTFDRLILLFRHHHPKEDLSASCDYNVRVLEFLVLLGHWIDLSSRTLLGPGSHWMLPNRYRPDFVYPELRPVPLVEQFTQERAVQTLLRRNWLGIRYASENNHTNTATNRHQPDDEHMDQDHDIRDNATKTQEGPKDAYLNPPNEEKPCLNTGIVSDSKPSRRLGPAAQSDDIKDYIRFRSLFSITLFELTPRFMELSADIASAIGPVNEHWIDLASQMIWQSALERLQQMPDSQYTKPSETPFQTIREDFGIRVWIEECFAWGHVSPPSNTSTTRIRRELAYLGARDESETSLQDKLAVEDRISAMFTTSKSSADEHENPKWTQTTTQAKDKLLDLIIEESPISDNIPFYLSVRKLCEQSPIKPFLDALLRYIGGLFDINASKDISGQPVLVQIEQGTLDGLSDLEFKAFLSRVGLKRSDGTAIKWAK